MLDERYFAHRLKSTSHAGVACTLMVIGWFAYNFYGRDVFRTDLLVIASLTALIKVALMIWYRFRD